MIDETDRKIIRASQAGLPLAPEPYAEIARQTGVEESEVIARMEKMLANGVIRRIGLVPNHMVLGWKANGMTVWDVEDDEIGRLGPLVGALDFVSHCYRRPRRLPRWPYNLFAMVHGANRSEVEQKAARITTLLGEHCQSHEIIYSKRILKKTGLRIG
jgi:DNA-binding Lrp family transcriptional regulator